MPWGKRGGRKGHQGLQAKRGNVQAFTYTYYCIGRCRRPSCCRGKGCPQSWSRLSSKKRCILSPRPRKSLSSDRGRLLASRMRPLGGNSSRRIPRRRLCWPRKFADRGYTNPSRRDYPKIERSNSRASVACPFQFWPELRERPRQRRTRIWNANC